MFVSKHAARRAGIFFSDWELIAPIIQARFGLARMSPRTTPVGCLCSQYACNLNCLLLENITGHLACYILGLTA